MADYKLAIQYYDSKMRSSIRKEKETHNKGYSLVELIVVIAIMAVMVGVMSLGLGMMFTRDANYVAVRIDDMLTEARTASMSREGEFTYVLHIDSDPKKHYVEIDKTGETDPYKKVLLDKSVNITVKDNAGNDLSGDIKIAFDKANGSVKSVNGSSPVSGTVYTINVESTKNSSKTKDVTLVATTGRHYTEK